MNKKLQIFSIIIFILVFLSIFCFILYSTISIGGIGVYFMIPFGLAFVGAITTIIMKLVATSKKTNKTEVTTDNIGRTIAVEGIKCVNCGCINEPGNSYCSHCGRPLEKECPNCHFKTNSDNEFCPKCGTKL